MKVVGRIFTVRYFLVTILIIGLAALSVEFFYGSFTDRLLDRTVGSADEAEQIADIGSLAGQNQLRSRDFNQIVERNVFKVSQGSLTAREPNREGDEIGQIVQRFVLKGTILAGNTQTPGRKRAVFTDLQSGKQKFYQIDDMLGAASIKEITRRYVVIEFNGRSHTIYQHQGNQAVKKPVVPVSPAAVMVDNPVARNPQAVQRIESASRDSIPDDGTPRVKGQQQPVGQQSAAPVDFRGKVIVE